MRTDHTSRNNNVGLHHHPQKMNEYEVICCYKENLGGASDGVTHVVQVYALLLLPKMHSSCKGGRF